MKTTRFITVTGLWLVAVVPIWLGWILVDLVLWPALRSGSLAGVPTVAFDPVGGSPMFHLTGLEVAVFAFGCLVLAMTLIAAGFFVGFNRTEREGSEPD